MDLASLYSMNTINLIFCITVVVLGLLRYRRTAVRAFLFIGLAYACFALSWTVQLMGWPVTGIGSIDAALVKNALTGVRMTGYCFLIFGMIL
jgi:hypothetical protein